MVLVFIKTTGGQVKALSLTSGEILEEGNIMARTTDKPSEAELMAMTKEQLVTLIDAFAINARNVQSGRSKTSGL